MLSQQSYSKEDLWVELFIFVILYFVIGIGDAKLIQLQ